MSSPSPFLCSKKGKWQCLHKSSILDTGPYDMITTMKNCVFCILLEFCASYSKSPVAWQGIQAFWNQWYRKFFISEILTIMILVIVAFVSNSSISFMSIFNYTDKEDTRYAKLLLASQDEVLKQVKTCNLKKFDMQ